MCEEGVVRSRSHDEHGAGQLSHLPHGSQAPAIIIDVAQACKRTRPPLISTPSSHDAVRSSVPTPAPPSPCRLRPPQNRATPLRVLALWNARAASREPRTRPETRANVPRVVSKCTSWSFPFMSLVRHSAKNSGRSIPPARHVHAHTLTRSRYREARGG